MKGWTDLCLASHLGLQHVVQDILLSDGTAGIHAKDEAIKAACMAVSNGHKTIVELLLDRDADFDIESGDLGEILVKASIVGDETVVEMLLNRGAEIDWDGGRDGTSLLLASLRGHQAVV